jgi:hypothetical protein
MKLNATPVLILPVDWLEGKKSLKELLNEKGN